MPLNAPAGISPWSPLWLQPQQRCLYAALHMPGDATVASSLGVLCVPALLHEQPRSRRFVAQVASGLASLGLPCMRFDFFGTGDSGGSGDQLDFASMQADIDIAIAALRVQAGVERVALLAWRGAALPVLAWLDSGRRPDALVLWEPITDGPGWLAQLQRDDARERACRPRPRPGVTRAAPADDGQLMGFAVSPDLRRDLSGACRTDTCWTGDGWTAGGLTAGGLTAGGLTPGDDAQPGGTRALAIVPAIPMPAIAIPTWAVTRQDGPTPPSALPLPPQRVLPLPDGAPTFDGGTHMEATFFLTPPLRRVVDTLGHALLAHASP